MKKVSIRTRVTHDFMSITVKIASGANFKLSLNRNGETLEFGLSNIPKVAKAQGKSLKKWLAIRTGENNIERFNRIKEDIKVENPQEAFDLYFLTQAPLPRYRTGEKVGSAKIIRREYDDEGRQWIYTTIPNMTLTETDMNAYAGN